MLIVIFWGTMPSNGLWLCVNMIYPKLYPNSLLVSLNSRTKLRAEPTSVMITRTVDLSGPSAQNPRTGTVVRMRCPSRTSASLMDLDDRLTLRTSVVSHSRI
jgi:hypothetical protein